MSRSFSFTAALPLLACSLLVPACASSDVDDELTADSPDQAIDGKADAPDGAYTYFAIKADLRKCASPVCGGFFMSRVNRSTTTCHDGSVKSACYSPVLDWSETDLDTGLQAKLVAASNKQGGVFALVRGRFAKKNTTTPRPELGKFVVTEAWVAEGNVAPEGVFAKVFENGIRCIAAPCPTLTEKGLNTGNTANIADLDFAPAGLTDRQVEGFVDQETAPQGIIVVGERYTFKLSGRSGKGRTVTNAFHLLAPAPATACYVGGCSSQVCSDHPGVITTCEARPEYACYHTATCEVQASGQCGWTPTPALNACLASH